MYRVKVGFLPLYRIEYPSSRYRVFQFLEPLQCKGFACTVLEAPQRDFLKRLLYLPRLWQLARTQDVLYIQKRTFPLPVLNSLKHLNSRLIFDLDDAIFLNPTAKPRVNAMIQAAAQVVAGNAYLAEYAQNINPRVVIIPTAVDTNIYCPPNGLRHPGDDRIIVGWIGSDPNRGDFQGMETNLNWLKQQYGNRVILKIVGRQPLHMSTDFNQDFVRWTLQDSISALQSFDIGIMPLPDTPWNRGKCGFKLIQYQAVGTPALASSTGVNPKIVQQGKTGLLASNSTEWQQGFEKLIEDRFLRQEMGIAARQHVESQFSIHANLPFLVETIRQVATIR